MILFPRVRQIEKTPLKGKVTLNNRRVDESLEQRFLNFFFFISVPILIQTFSTTPDYIIIWNQLTFLLINNKKIILRHMFVKHTNYYNFIIY